MAELPKNYNPVAELRDGLEKLGREGIDINLAEILPDALGSVHVAVTPKNYKGWMVRLRLAVFLFWLGSKVAGFSFDEEEADG